MLKFWTYISFSNNICFFSFLQCRCILIPCKDTLPRISMCKLNQNFIPTPTNQMLDTSSHEHTNPPPTKF